MRSSRREISDRGGSHWREEGEGVRSTLTRDGDVGKGKGKDGFRMGGWREIGDDGGDGVRGDRVCLGRGV